VFGIQRLFVIVSIVLFTLLETGVELSVRLSNVFLVSCLAGQLVYTITAANIGSLIMSV
jgi:hypothetical protein